MQTAHRTDVVIAEEAQNEVALAEQIAPLLRRPLRMLLDGAEQLCLQLHHLRDLPPGKHAPHQYEEREGMGFQCLRRASVQCLEDIRRLQGGEEDARIAADHAEQCVVVLALPIRRDGVDVLLLFSYQAP